MGLPGKPPPSVTTLKTVWYGMVWYGMVWYGMDVYGMVWYGRVQYSMVCYGMVRLGVVWNPLRYIPQNGLALYGMVS